MDKPRADHLACVQDVRELADRPLLVQLPLYRQERFHGVVDLLSMQRIEWDLEADASGGVVASRALDGEDRQLLRTATQLREELIGSLCEHDAQLGESVLQVDDLRELPTPTLVNALRRCTIRNQVCPVLMGSSFKNLGVQLLLDSIVKLLPSPLEINHQLLRRFDKQLCAFAFKVLFHQNLGNLTFVRVFSGRLQAGGRIYNQTRKLTEKVAKLYVPFADSFQEAQYADAGSIVAVSGLLQSYTGDSLMLSREFGEQLHKEWASQPDRRLSTAENLIAHGLKPPAPVYFCSIEAPSVSKQKDLEFALQRLQKEDPSFTVKTNEETDQMVLNGMGELHIDVGSCLQAPVFKSYFMLLI